MGSLLKFAILHALEQVEIFCDAPLTRGTVLARFCEGTTIAADFLGAELTDIGLAQLDQLHGEVVELIKIVRGEKEILAPVKAQPADIILDGCHVGLFFLARIGIVEAQMAGAVVFFCDAEVEADGLGVADVQKTVGLGRKTCYRPRVFAAMQVFVDDLANEIDGFVLRFRRC